MDARNLLSLSGVLLVLGTAGYYWGMGHQQKIGPETEEKRRPDYVVTTIESRETDEQGRLLRDLQAAELRHYDKPQEEAEIDRPMVLFYDNGRPAWHLTAQRGSSFNQNTEVHLDGGVHAERRDPQAVPLTFDTENVQVFPREERLSTKSAVKVESPQGRLDGHGLEASMKTGDLVLTENVTGNYAPAVR